MILPNSCCNLCYIISYCIIWWHDMLCYVMSCHIMSCHVMSCHVMSCHVMSCHVMSCHIILFRIMSCYIMWCDVLSCHCTVVDNGRNANYWCPIFAIIQHFIMPLFNTSLCILLDWLSSIITSPLNYFSTIIIDSEFLKIIIDYLLWYMISVYFFFCMI